ncbi:MAG: aminotransferase class III-fold pyridoxal phosphate-dependent enzyme [Lentisphaerae bacterium]|jgi:4-aminobutyrate aminotransferase-like enzyme|nr:aminotransferase class III-fold pyridoxal phosphate-dependent enzyme [Lentisphaerota bacterium]MBT5607502.1 aminotransferase class III-fold pyridoxal phosphate-dependent enzyme [Lentisphaerota bacterium]MBT7058206.1 aminotransferase class III-fold pyridoxal phosphate-dependent enzyme [Lentisphaerota bacterium]MBT7840749.1 aminotransferase class III-fold pyridoxal phosphate-dependent enzyme [Lentisphaerota bacterium]
MKTISRSLCDLLGADYIAAVCETQSFLTGADPGALKALASESVDFFPEALQSRLDELLEKVGMQVARGLNGGITGAPTAAFGDALHQEMAPLAGLGPIRVGEDGRAYFIGKSEHYHASLGHAFPGYRLIENAKRLGICNATHNNTRGYITRLAERELVRVANGLGKGDEGSLSEVLATDEPHVLNRVVNLETGSLAVEAALKMMLARFYHLDATAEEPPYAGRTPVFLVMADHAGGRTANYHGTTVLTQVLRGMWPGLSDSLEEHGQYVVRPVAINDAEHFEQLVDELDYGPYKVAGFLHELVLMNYGAIKLTAEFVARTHALCKDHDIPILVDEIQSCIWSPEIFLFREYACRPDFVSAGKGFPGGEYAGSKILTTAAMDNLNQFGALVTNGQEELASLAYLVTIEFAEANGEHTREIGAYYHAEAIKLMAEFPALITQVEGEAHMTSLFFDTPECASRFAAILSTDFCIDVSAQTYKADCPPAALTKLPLISSRKAVDFVIGRMREALGGLG